MGTSIRPVFLILPASENAFVPVLPSVPIDLNHFEPLLMMPGTFAKVSTLLRQVGALNRPWSTLLGGLVRGVPRLPSIEVVMAEPSPQTNAPAPLFILSLKVLPEPRMFSPIRPYSSA